MSAKATYALFSEIGILLHRFRPTHTIPQATIRQNSELSPMPEQLEKRVALLEAEVARLKRKVESDLSPTPWWEKIAGTFADNPAYDEAMRLGREYRESLRSGSTESFDE